MAGTLSAKEIDLSIIVVAYNVKELCDECFRAIRASKDTLTKEILFVDNGSVDGTADHVAEHFPEVTLIRSPTNLGFIRANNLAYKRANGKYILMLNSDAFVCENTLQETVDFMRKHPETGVVGARLVGRDGVLQPSARYFPTPLKSFLNQAWATRQGAHRGPARRPELGSQIRPRLRLGRRLLPSHSKRPRGHHGVFFEGRFFHVQR